MLKPARHLATLGMCLALALTSFGQTSKRRKAGTTRRKTTRTIVLTEIGVSPWVTVRTVGTADVAYNAETNQTLISTSLPALETTQYKELLELNAAIIISGKEIVKLDVVKFEIIAPDGDNGVQFKSGTGVHFQADGKLYSFSKVVKKRFVSDIVSQTEITGQIPFSTFEQIVNSEKIALIIGTNSCPFSEQHREMLRDLLRATQPSTGGA